MKQLKFMLAAATAISLATAAQADNKTTSTGFERATVGSVGTATLDYDEAPDSYFFYDGESLSENESKIEEATAPDIETRPKGYKKLVAGEQTQTKVLNVNTGEDPLLRTINPIKLVEGVWQKPDAVTLSQDTYVDTLVKFTVTPAGDDPDPSDEDKLMVYLKESATDTEGVTVTNLVVKGGLLNLEGTVESADFIAKNVSVLPNKWYRLTVKAVANLGGFEGYKFPGFYVYIDNTLLTYDKNAFARDEAGAPSAPFDEYYAEDATIDEPVEFSENKVVFSLLANGSVTPTLQAVGFAGEGSVDDFIVTTDDPFAEDPSTIDFTLALGEGVSAVTWTVGVDKMQLNSDLTSYKAENVAGKAIAITGVEYAAGYAGTEDWANWSIAANVLTESTNVVVAATKFGDVENGVVKPTDDTIAAAASGAFACNATDPAVYAEEVAKLGKAVTWATSVAKKSYADAMTCINAMDFDEVTTNNVSEAAYLLNCEPTAEEVKKAFADFSFSSADLAALIAFEAGTETDAPVFALEGKEYNGKLTIKGAKSLGAWFDVEDGKIASGVDGAKEVPNFLKAVLTK